MYQCKLATKVIGCHTNNVLKYREITKIILLSSDPNLNVTGRITSIFNDSWIRLAEANKENTLPYMPWFRERTHLFLGNIPIIQQLTSSPLIYIP